MKRQTFYSNGKLLITGEYTVLDGATALALPTKYGQYLHIEESKNDVVKWISKDVDGSVWFEAAIPFSAIKGSVHSGQSEYNTLVNILHEAYKANPKILRDSQGHTITTELTFPRKWGLGTSSTLINNIAQWFSIDAYDLLNKSFGGSGYDIACAQNNSPILYRLEKGLPIVTPVDFNPAFTNSLYFVYLNRKQSSKEAIAAYRKKKNELTETVSKIKLLTEKTVNSCNLLTFNEALEQHETVMASILETPTVKEKLFGEFNGTIKSLGAWGGDFVLAVSEDDPTAYFQEKGYETIIPYNRMIL